MGTGAAPCTIVWVLQHLGSGKVREIYEVDDKLLLFVASDRISAFDVVLPDLIPDKGQVLTGLSRYFFDLLDTPHHFVSMDLENVPGLRDTDRTELNGKAMIVQRAAVVPLECIVRGYLYGSAYKEYQNGGGPSTEGLPAGLVLADRLAEPIFTPSTKADAGHDENLTEADARNLVGNDLYDELQRRSTAIYLQASDHARDRGVILADTKVEFGLVGDELLLVDEVLTPDSSRYWPADQWQPGHEVPSFDKQYVRDWLDVIGWDRTPPAPRLPADVIAGTRARYLEAYRLITGRNLS